MNNKNAKHAVTSVLVALTSIAAVPVWAVQLPSCRPWVDSKVIYVDAAARGSNNGSDWRNAYTGLQQALNAAAASAGNEQIWIAHGTYPVPNGAGYVLPSGVQLFGGFLGSERYVGERDPSRNTTTLSGNATASRVLVADQATIQIDGVIVTGGMALGDIAADAQNATNEVRGGGLLAINADVTVCNATFTGNRAKKFGGAIFQRGGSLKVSDTTFTDNSVLRGEHELHDSDAEADTDGGAIAVHNVTLVQVYGSRFENNVAGDDGGAIAARDIGAVEIVDSRFVRNKGIALIRPVVIVPGVSTHTNLVSSMGGAVQLWNEYIGFNNGNQAKSILIKDSEFVENQAAIAGAAYIESTPGSKTVISGTKFLRNGGNGEANPSAPPNEQGVTFGRSGGAIMVVSLRWGDREEGAAGNFLRPQHSINIERSVFEDNSAGYGGAMQLIGMNGKIEQSSFTRNLARQRGGAVLTSNMVSLFDQLAGMRAGLGAMLIDRSEFYDNTALGISENLLNEDFPGLVTDEEQSFGGGAIFSEASFDLTIDRSVFTRNSARNSDGGAIHNAVIHMGIFGMVQPPFPASYGSHLTVKRSRFLENRTIEQGSGGAIANGGSRANGMIADRSGADARVGAAGATSVVQHSRFEGNTAVNEGGALANWNGSTLQVTTSKIINNSAARGAGVASLGASTAAAASLNVHHSLIRGNRAAITGGGVFARDTVGELTYSDVSGNAPNDVDWR